MTARRRHRCTVALAASFLPALLPTRLGMAMEDPGALLAAPPGPVASATPAAGALCLPAIAAAEQSERLPPHLLRSIAFVESGRVDPATGRAVPWPWTINAAGTGLFYASKEEAVAAVQSFQARGVRSIDVGCAQVSLLHHPAAFASLDAAFDPQANAAYAARFLTALRRATGSWPLAAAGYHSQTASIGYDYARRVLAIWPGASRYGDLPPLPPGAAGGGGAAQQPAAVDYSRYTPAFAAWMRRMDEDRARILAQVRGPVMSPAAKSASISRGRQPATTASLAPALSPALSFGPRPPTWR